MVFNQWSEDFLCFYYIISTSKQCSIKHRNDNCMKVDAWCLTLLHEWPLHGKNLFISAWNDQCMLLHVKPCQLPRSLTCTPWTANSMARLVTTPQLQVAFYHVHGACGRYPAIRSCVLLLHPRVGHVPRNSNLRPTSTLARGTCTPQLQFACYLLLIFFARRIGGQTILHFII